MLSAEVQRIILIVALVATGYLLMLAWQEDYGQPAVQPAQVEAPTVATDPSDIGPTQDIPSQIPVDAIEQISDVPDASLVGGPPHSKERRILPPGRQPTSD